MTRPRLRIPDDLWTRLTAREKESNVFRLRLRTGRTVDSVLVGRDAEISTREVDTAAEYTLEGLDFASEDIVAVEIPQQTGGQRRRWVGGVVRYRQGPEFAGEFTFRNEDVVLEIRRWLDAARPTQPGYGLVATVLAVLLYPFLWLLSGRKWPPGVFRQCMFGGAVPESATEAHRRVWAAGLLRTLEQDGGDMPLIGPECPLDESFFLGLIRAGRVKEIRCLECGSRVTHLSEEEGGYDHGPLAMSHEPMYHCENRHILLRVQMLQS